MRFCFLELKINLCVKMSSHGVLGTQDGLEPSTVRLDCTDWLDYLSMVPDHSLPRPKPRLGFSCGKELYVDVSTLPDAGYGLFSNTFFVPGDTISLYDGIVIDKSEAGAAASCDARSQTHTCAIRGTEYRILGLRFTLRGRGLGSFANHSPRNNAALRVKRIKVRYFNHLYCPFLDSCVVLEACEYISPGQEILVKYSRSTLIRLDIQ